MKQHYIVLKDDLAHTLNFRLRETYCAAQSPLLTREGKVFFTLNERGQMIGVLEKWCKNVFVKDDTKEPG